MLSPIELGVQLLEILSQVFFSFSPQCVRRHWVLDTRYAKLPMSDIRRSYDGCHDTH